MRKIRLFNSKDFLFFKLKAILKVNIILFMKKMIYRMKIQLKIKNIHTTPEKISLIYPKNSPGKNISMMLYNKKIADHATPLPPWKCSVPESILNIMTQLN
jgi:hypothetical protein